MGYQAALVIMNPVAGQHDPDKTRTLIEQRLTHEQLRYEIRETKEAGDALRWAEQAAAEGFDRGSLLLIADGARSLRSFYTDRLTQVPDKTRLLDWYHLHQKCADLSSRICRGKQARARLLLRLYRRLWRGDVVGTITMLQDYRRQARNGEVLDTLIAYLQARQAWIPNYPQRRREQQYIGSEHVEKANDLIVARRQKRPGMQWSQDTRAALATLRTRMLNGGWERDWQHRAMLPVVAT